MKVTLKRTALYEDHCKLNAKMMEFGGWEMPLSYSTGTIAEHMAVRNSAAMFDVSHLGTVRLMGPDAFNQIQRTLTNDLGKISPGHAQYTHLLNDRTGSVEDDIIVWWIDEEVFDVMPNASNTSRVLAALPGIDTTDERVVIAVQGPRARAAVVDVFNEARDVPHFHVSRSSYLGHPIVISGTGYTGEDGVEISVPNPVASSLWNRLLDLGVIPAGLGARDTLRLEAGLPLHGHELGEGITPLQSGLGWVVAFGKPEFLGRDALLAEKAQGVSRKLVGLKGFSRQPFRQGQDIVVDGRKIGATTSGNYSPVLQVGIAMGFVEPAYGAGQKVAVEAKGGLIPAEIVKLPFVKKAYTN